MSAEYIERPLHVHPMGVVKLQSAVAVADIATMTLVQQDVHEGHHFNLHRMHSILT